MDNVLVDFQSGLDRIDEETKSRYRAKWSGGKDRLDEIPGLFGKMDPMPGAIEAVHKLAEEYDVFILSTAPWKNPSAWSDKVEWVTKYFDDVFHKRIIITHRKDLVEGDYLIDDRGKNGTSEFKGEWIQFGSEKFPDWDAVLNYLIVPLRKYPLKLHIRYLTNPHESSSMHWPYNEPTKYAGEQIYTVMLTEREQEMVRMMMFGAQRTSSARKISERIKGEIKGVLDNSLGMDCDPNWIECEWASGEKERLTAELRYLNLQDVMLMKSRVAEKGENICHEDLLSGLENCCVYHEVWTRETGHLWEKVTLLERNPSEEEYDYADTWDFYPLRLSNLSTASIVKMLGQYITQ